MKKIIIYVLVFLLCVGSSILGSVLLTDYKLSKMACNCNKEELTSKKVMVVEENNLKSSLEKIYDATILVQTYIGTQAYGSGTGFVYKTDNDYGYILTNHHVVSGSNKIKVTFNNEKQVDAELLGSDEYADLAVLRVPVDAVIITASLGESADMQIGDTVYTVGSPLGSKYIGTVTKGILSGKDRLVSVRLTNGYFRMNVLQTDAAVNPGNSGGPLVNINGDVIGIISMKLVEDEIEGMGFAIPIEVAIAYAPQLEKGENIERPILGAELADVTSSYALYLYRIYLSNKVTYGAVILDTEKGYPVSDKLQRGDVIIAIDNQKIEDSSHLRYILYKYSVGDEIKINFIRGEEEREVTVTLDKAA